jgi:hypothetical protein
MGCSASRKRKLSLKSLRPAREGGDHNIFQADISVSVLFLSEILEVTILRFKIMSYFSEQILLSLQ